MKVNEIVIRNAGGKIVIPKRGAIGFSISGRLCDSDEAKEELNEALKDMDEVCKATAILQKIEKRTIKLTIEVIE